jgi:peptidoglycan/xylan/chitin deacetylase (PgdA/CDA1 family)
MTLSSIRATVGGLQDLRLITISVDDGHPTDVKAAELLRRLGLKATFYVPALNVRRPVMPESDVRGLSECYEIGAHTYSHVRLTTVTLDEARKEIDGGKQWVESVTGLPARSFCYPGGKFNPGVVTLVKEAGFAGARTCMQNVLGPPRVPQQWGVTTQVYEHPRHVHVAHALRERNWRGLANFVRVFKGVRDWEAHFVRAAEFVHARGGVAHLWFHSWEVEKNGDWQRLERLLEYVRSEFSLTPVTNGDLFAAFAADAALHTPLANAETPGGVAGATLD